MLKGDPDAVSVTEDCRKLLRDFKSKGVNAVMVDLRGFGGSTPRASARNWPV